MELTNDQIKALKGKGFIINKDDINFSCRVVTPGGKIDAEKAKKITEVSEKYGKGYFTLTQRLDVEIPGIEYHNLDSVASELIEVGLSIGGTGNRVRAVNTCKGNLCKLCLYDADEITSKLNDRFYKGFYDVTLPNKLRINISGCSNNCSSSGLACIGLNCKKSNQVAITIGGMAGKAPVIGKELRGLYSIDEAMDIIEKTIIYFKENGQQGERFTKMVERIGFITIEKALLG